MNNNYLRIWNTKITIKANEKSEILFIERAYQYLKENSILAIVLPDGILSNSNLSIRYSPLKYFTPASNNF